MYQLLWMVVLVDLSLFFICSVWLSCSLILEWPLYREAVGNLGFWQCFAGGLHATLVRSGMFRHSLKTTQSKQTRFLTKCMLNLFALKTDPIGLFRAFKMLIFPRSEINLQLFQYTSGRRCYPPPTLPRSTQRCWAGPGPVEQAVGGDPWFCHFAAPELSKCFCSLRRGLR